METIARHIVTSSGPSGTNREYLYQLAAAVRHLVMDGDATDTNGDPHLFELENLVRSLEQANDSSHQHILDIRADGQHDTRE